MGQFGVACPKPETRKRTKARLKRQAAAIEKLVRLLVGHRDGDCRIGTTTALLGPCDGESEWAHLENSRRFKTRGQPAEVRHTTAGTCRLCTKHHAMYDREKTLAIEFLTDKGADGTMRFQAHGVSVLSVPRRSESWTR